jgi:hypothetical protein
LIIHLRWTHILQGLIQRAALNSSEMLDEGLSTKLIRCIGNSQFIQPMRI